MTGEMTANSSRFPSLNVVINRKRLFPQIAAGFGSMSVLKPVTADREIRSPDRPGLGPCLSLFCEADSPLEKLSPF